MFGYLVPGWWNCSGRIGRRGPVGEGVHWALGFQKPMPFPGSSLPASYLGSFQVLPQCHVCLPAAMLATMMVTNLPSKTIDPRTFSSIVAVAMVPLGSDIEVTKTDIMLDYKESSPLTTPPLPCPPPLLLSLSVHLLLSP